MRPAPIGIDFAQRQSQPALSDAITAVAVGAVERDGDAVGALLDADEQPGVVGTGDRDLQPQGHGATEFSIFLEDVVLEGGGLILKVEGDGAAAIVGPIGEGAVGAQVQLLPAGAR